MLRRLISTIACLLLACPIAGSLRADEFQAGVAVVDITPPVPYRMSGYFSERLSTGAKDPLLAKAVVFRQGDERAALVFCDLVGISRDVSQAVRRQAAERTGIPPEHIAIAATHSHTGPLYFGALREHFHRQAVQKLGGDPYETADYPAELKEKLVAAIEQAAESLAPAALAAGFAEERRLSFNRRFHMKNGEVQFNPGQLNPNIVRAAGPIDPQVGLVSLTKQGEDRPYAALVAFALHLDTVGGTEYSADYPRHLQDSLQETYGKGFTSLFGAGTCGDINHVDVATRGRRGAEEIGGLLGETARAGLPKLAPVARLSLAVKSASFDAPLQRYSAEEIAQAEKDMDRVASSDVPFLDRVKAYKIMALRHRGGTTMPIEVQAFRLSGDVAVVTLPGEVFVELGLAVKEASPFATTLVIELANDAPGYLPTKKAFSEGSYEVVNSRIESGQAERMVQTAIRLLKELREE